MSVSRKIGDFLSLVKFSHTVFALPFALLGFFLGVHESGAFSWMTLVYVTLCMVFARSAAMAFNRLQDRDIDVKNPRTAVREIPAGKISSRSALLFVIGNSVAFMATTFLINPLCFYLSPVALVVILGYSYTKRFTYLCHFVLGLGLALAISPFPHSGPCYRFFMYSLYYFGCLASILFLPSRMKTLTAENNYNPFPYAWVE